MAKRIELWELTGPYWRLPIRVVWTEDLAEVRVGGGLTLLKKQIAVADETLARVGTPSGQKFYCERQKLEAVARKSEFDDPEDIVDWASIKEKPSRSTDYATSDFIHTYCTSAYAVIRDPLLADVVWLSFCKHMLDVLLNKRQEVTMFFAKIVPLCFRRNWAMAIVNAEREGRKRVEIKKGEFLNPAEKSMIERGIGEWLTSPRVTAQSDGYFRHTLEIIPNREWEDMALRLEIERKSRYRHGRGYIGSVRQLLLRQLPMALEAYAYYCKETKFACGTIPYYELDGRTRKPIRHSLGNHENDFTPSTSTTRSKVRTVDDLVFNRYGEGCTKYGSGQTEKRVPKVPDLQSEDTDMWDTGGQVQECDGTTATDGVPVLDAI